MTLIKQQQQQQVAEQRGMPVEVVADSSVVVNVSGETVQLQYYNSGVLTNDAGQAAGTVVVAKLANGSVLNALGDVIGNDNDTSLSFTSTALTSRVAFPYLIAELHDCDTGSNKANAITANFTNGQYCVDHRTGTLYAKKASTQTTLANAAYKIASANMSTASGPDSDVNVVSWGGTATTLGQKAMAASVPVVIASNQTGFGVPSTLLDGTITTTVGAGATAIAAATTCQYVIVQALTTNTMSIFVGNAGSQNIELGAGDAWSFAIDDLSKVYFTVQVDGEGLAYSGAN